MGKPARHGADGSEFSVPHDPSDYFRLLLCHPASLSLWPPWLSGAPPGVAHPLLGPFSHGLRLSPAVPRTGFDLNVPISPAPFLLLPAPCLWLSAAEIWGSPR